MLIIIVNCKWKSKSEYFTHLAIILDFEAIKHHKIVNKQFQMIHRYKKHMVWHQHEVSSSITLRDILFLIKTQITMVAILDFSILSKLLKGVRSTPIWIFWGCQTWIIRREKKLYQTKQGLGKYVVLAARLIECLSSPIHDVFTTCTNALLTSLAHGAD